MRYAYNKLNYVNTNTHVHKATALEYIYGLVQERRNFIANSLELRLSCTNTSIYN